MKVGRERRARAVRMPRFVVVGPHILPGLRLLRLRIVDFDVKGKNIPKPFDFNV